MPKLAIYVPKKQMKVIEKYRKRLNFSQIFMQALEAEIGKQSPGPGEDRLAKAAAFYKQQMSQREGSVVDYGLDLGRQHVLDCDLSLETLNSLLEIARKDAPSDQDYGEIQAAMGKDWRRCEGFLETQGFAPADSPSEEDNAAFVAAARELDRGYVRGVAETWQQVSEQMKDDH